MNPAPSPQAQQVHRAAMAAAQQGNSERAVALMKESIALAPDNAVFESNFGVLLRMLGRLDEAVAHWRRAAELDPRTDEQAAVGESYPSIFAPPPHDK